MMDAATLYIIMTLPSGEQRIASTLDFSSMWKCEAKVAWLQLIETRHPQAPGTVTSYRCGKHKFRPGFYLEAYDRRARPRDHVEPLSRQGCTAFKWVIHMRDRGLTAQCYELDRSSDDAKPDPYDGLLKP